MLKPITVRRARITLTAMRTGLEFSGMAIFSVEKMRTTTVN
jgi:hypothetical protein